MMKRIVPNLTNARRFLLVGLMGLFLMPASVQASGGIAAFLTARWQPWSFIEAAGGMAVDEPVRQPNGTWFLPVRCDVSGLTFVTLKPTVLNSALVVKTLKGERRGKVVVLSLITCVTSKAGFSSRTRGVSLGALSEGTYDVVYENPNHSTVFVRNIAVGLQRLMKDTGSAVQRR